MIDMTIEHNYGLRIECYNIGAAIIFILHSHIYKICKLALKARYEASLVML
jgi:hypothetical protein